jgi:hypothetical protein
MTEHNPRTDWLSAARWGVMAHFIAEIFEANTESLTVERWNEMVDGFDVPGLGRQLDEIRPGYYLTTVTQNSGFVASPNAAYDKYVGREVSRCSRRDLVADLIEELEPRGIPLIIYLPSDAPWFDLPAVAKFQGRFGPYRNREFQLMWEDVVREFAERWGTHIKGWWFDGCYQGESMYFQPDEPNLHSFARAARAGNPDAILAFNPGVMIKAYGDEEDYTAGEINEPETVECRGRWFEGEQWHMLTFLGSIWGQRGLRYSAEQIAEITRNAVAEGGAVTYDMPPQPNGLYYPEFMEVMRGLNEALAEPGREKISVAVTDPPLISEAGRSHPGQVRYRVKNLSTGRLSSTLVPRAVPSEALAFLGATAIPYDLQPGQEVEILVDFDLAAETAAPRVSAEGSTLPVPVIPRQEILIQRVPATFSLAELEPAMAGVKPRRLLAEGAELAEIRLARTDDFLAVQAQVTDRAMKHSTMVYDGTCLEVWGAPYREEGFVGATPQFYLRPALAGVPASALRPDPDNPLVSPALVPDIAVQSRELPEGYTLTALIPLEIFGVDPAAKIFVFELSVSATPAPERGLVRQKLFGAPAPWISTDGFGLLVEEA